MRGGDERTGRVKGAGNHWAIVREIISIRLACIVHAGAQEKRQEGRQNEEKSQEVYTSRMREATPSGRIPTKVGKCFRLTDVIKHAQFHRYTLKCFWAVRCWSFHVAISSSLTLCFALPRSRWSKSMNCFYVRLLKLIRCTLHSLINFPLFTCKWLELIITRYILCAS